MKDFDINLRKRYMETSPSRASIIMRFDLKKQSEKELFEHIEKCAKLPRLFNFDEIRDTVEYAYWEPSSYKCWYDNV